MGATMWKLWIRSYHCLMVLFRCKLTLASTLPVSPLKTACNQNVSWVKMLRCDLLIKGEFCLSKWVTSLKLFLLQVVLSLSDHKSWLYITESLESCLHTTESFVFSHTHQRLVTVCLQSTCKQDLNLSDGKTHEQAFQAEYLSNSFTHKW